jgi:hypothetical protein
MSTDVSALSTTNAEIAQTLANMQRTLDQLQQQQTLLAQAVLNVIRGRWDAAQFGTQSVESFVVAFDPALHGKVEAVRFEAVPLAIAR